MSRTNSFNYDKYSRVFFPYRHLGKLEKTSSTARKLIIGGDWDPLPIVSTASSKIFLGEVQHIMFYKNLEPVNVLYFWDSTLRWPFPTKTRGPFGFQEHECSWKSGSINTIDKLLRCFASHEHSSKPCSSNSYETLAASRRPKNNGV